MDDAELFEDVRDELCARRPGVERATMMGHRSIKADGRLFACYTEARGGTAFKLEDERTHAEALALEGAKLFDPGGRGKPFKQWVVVPPTHAKRWLEFAERALDRT